MENATCGNCRFWGDKDQPDGRRRCNAIPHDPNVALDGWPLWKDCDPTLPNIAVVIDAEHYSAQLRTKADFACILHQPRQPETS